jgi:N-acetylmuramoyl-L-alanine amidase
MRARARAARFAAPVAFLLAVTVAVLLVRSGLENGEAGSGTTTTTTATTTAPATTEPGATAPTTTGGGQERFYVIQAGDTLAAIAEEQNTTVEQLLVLNPELDPVALTVGQRIRVE